MIPQPFLALRPGRAERPLGTSVQLSVRSLGTLRVPSGRLGICDPFDSLDDPLVVSVPAGDYSVRATLATFGDSPAERERPLVAYLSLVLSEEPTATLGPARAEPETLGMRGWDSVPALFPRLELPWLPAVSATLALVDAEALAEGLPTPPPNWATNAVEYWYSTVFEPEPDGWFARISASEPLPEGLAEVPLPLAPAGENLIMTATGWGDGQFPVLETRDAAGALTGIHLDLLVVGGLLAALHAEEEAADTTDTPDTEDGLPAEDPDHAGDGGPAAHDGADGPPLSP